MITRKYMRSATALIFLINILFFPSISRADEKVTTLNEGDTAPFSGTLFNTEAAARLITELSFTEESCQIKIDEALSYQAARHQLEISNLNISLETLELRYDQTLALRSDQIAFLDSQITKKKFPHELTFALGVLAGIGLTLASAYAISEVAQ